MQDYLNNLTTQDHTVFAEIEALRVEIRSKNLLINVVDYGAGEPEENRSKEQMHSGVLKQVRSKDLCRIGLKNEYAHLIYALLKKFQPKTVLELGTCCGFSSIYMSKALDAQATVHTIEGSPETAQLAKANLLEANCLNVTSHVGRFDDVLPSLLPSLAPISFAFIDGHHDKDATLNYFEQIKPFLAQNALVLFDDISWSQGMKEAWAIISKDTDIDYVEDFHKVGLCHLNKEAK